VQCSQKFDDGVEVRTGHDDVDMALRRPSCVGNPVGDAIGELVECDDTISCDDCGLGAEGAQLLECQGSLGRRCCAVPAAPTRDGSRCGDTNCLIQTHDLKGNATGSCKATLTICKCRLG